jgi:hypothetical protein
MEMSSFCNAVQVTRNSRKLRNDTIHLLTELFIIQAEQFVEIQVESEVANALTIGCRSKKYKARIIVDDLEIIEICA